jgi:hypothetical protein
MRRPMFLCTIGLLVSAGPLAAQRIPTFTLPPADVVHPHEFTSVTSVRELSDGRVIVTDGREQRLLVLDFATGESREIGRKGSGPNEYTMVGFVRAIAGDSSAFPDLLGRRWLLLSGDRIVTTIPPDDPAVLASQGYFVGADVRGNVVRRVNPPVRDGLTLATERDSGAVVMIARATGKADTVTWVRSAPRRITRSTNAQGRVTSSSTQITQLLPAEEDFVLFPDGALAVGRHDPFRVDWRLPDGRWVRGDSIPIPKIRVTARERRAYEDRQTVSATPMPRPAGVPDQLKADFPDFIPAFPFGQGLFQGPQGQLLVRRTKSADFPAMTYLVIDRRGKLTGTFTLSNREKVEGVSERAIYISERDEDDLVFLRRHPFR